jgi:hypothetical protein
MKTILVKRYLESQEKTGVLQSLGRVRAKQLPCAIMVILSIFVMEIVCLGPAVGGTSAIGNLIRMDVIGRAVDNKYQIWYWLRQNSQPYSLP